MRKIRLDNEAFLKLDNHSRLLLRLRFGDGLMKQFVAFQIEFAQKSLGDLNPDEAKTPEEFMQTAREQRMILQFWLDFQACCEDWGIQSAQER